MAKGGQYERDFCKRLSRWWTDGERDDVFWRTSQSGGRATTRAKRGKATKNQYGDVCAVDAIGQPLMDVVTIELKRGYAKDTIHDLLDKPDGAAEQKFEKWIDKAKHDAAKALSFSWMLITRRDRHKEIVWIHTRFKSVLLDDVSIFIPDYLFFSAKGIWGFTLDDWFHYITPDDIQRITKRYEKIVRGEQGLPT